VPGIFSAPLEREFEASREALDAAALAAIADMDTMRTREGAALAKDLGERIERVQSIVSDLAARAPELAPLYRQRLQERIERLELRGEGLDGSRLAQEVALFAERIDIAEELTRLASHLDQSRGLLTKSEPVGRRLDFLLQEMARETNTIGAKSPDSRMSQAIVEVKAEIERLREQVQNVE
jgi:uncharacterized protein (TIGR00255 family)